MAELKMDNNDGNTVGPDPLYFFLEPQLVGEKPDSENKLNAASSMRWRMDPAGYVF